MTPLEMAQKYYPVLWDDARLDQLVQAGILEQSCVTQLRNEETVQNTQNSSI